MITTDLIQVENEDFEEMPLGYVLSEIVFGILLPTLDNMGDTYIAIKILTMELNFSSNYSSLSQALSGLGRYGDYNHFVLHTKYLYSQRNMRD